MGCIEDAWKLFVDMSKKGCRPLNCSEGWQEMVCSVTYNILINVLVEERKMERNGCLPNNMMVENSCLHDLHTYSFLIQLWAKKAR
jgi:hypothetical protein